MQGDCAGNAGWGMDVGRQLSMNDNKRAEKVMYTDLIAMGIRHEAILLPRRAQRVVTKMSIQFCLPTLIATAS